MNNLPLTALGLTLLFEVPLVALAIRVFALSTQPVRRIMLVAVLASLCTQPVVYALSFRDPTWLAHYELGAVLFEGALYWKLLDLAGGDALSLSAVANLVSFTLGLWLFSAGVFQ